MTSTPSPGPVTSPGAPSDLVRALHELMEDWAEATYTANFLGSVGESSLIYVTSSGINVRLIGEDTWDADQIAYRLRTESHTPETGPWYGIQVKLTAGGEPQTTLLFGELPAWDHQIPESAYQEELRLFPRNDAAIPGWLREKTGLAPASPAGAGVPRRAKVFDGTNPGTGLPVVTRPQLRDGEAPRVLAYLKAGPVVLFAHSYAEDAYYPEKAPAVPLTFATDGAWVWPGAVAYYLERYEMPPEGEFLEHIRARNYEPPEVSEQELEAARLLLATGMTSGS